ncbi:MAG: Asp23/Gls24 family envelope stress response protein [Oscillospiraceae bacterium]|nr:Asp23/Gls24 family envelope stress response protein [Oscillospiraceae bacterium]MCD8117260.1 Asp23/Gls24 family envelope stress response protein [Oscillospiraceae bacterium]
MIQKASEKGVIDISTDVFTTIVGDAASSCFGVKGMAGRGSGIWQLLSPESMSKGVEVRFEEDNSLIADLHIVVDHGVNLYALSTSIIAEVAYKVTAITGVPVSQVNVFIDSMSRD